MDDSNAIRERLKAFRARVSDKAGLDPVMAAAAVMHRFDPRALASQLRLGSKDLQARLAGHIELARDEAGKLRWVLDPIQRQRVLERLATTSDIQKILDHYSMRLKDPVQLAFELLVERGWSLDPGKIEDRERLEALLVATKWLEKTNVPRPDIRSLERQSEVLRMRHELAMVASPYFKGREKLLDELADFTREPGAPVLVLHARGGLGKSAVVARLLQNLGAFREGYTVPVAYLDFDSASLDVGRPLTVLHEIARQLELQLDHNDSRAPDLLAFASEADTQERFETTRPRPDLNTMSVERFVVYLGEILRNASWTGDHGLFVIMETFERAQSRDVELAASLVEMLQKLHTQGGVEAVRILVTGRASVPRFKRHKELAPLRPRSARALLLALGIEDEGLRDALAIRVGGSPLALKLAARLANDESITAEKLADGIWDEALNSALVEGGLYRRILGRIEHRAAAQIAHPGLVLRRLTPEVILGVLVPALGLKDLPDLESAQLLLAQLAKVHDLVLTGRLEPTGPVSHVEVRPAIRRTVLGLMIKDTKRAQERRRVHTQAIAWFDQQETPSAAAESVYHALMLGQLDDAERRWKTKLSEFLGQDDLHDLAPTSAQWLATKLKLDYVPLTGSGNVPQELSQTQWERRVLDKIEDFVKSGSSPDAALKLLAERNERRPDTLLYYGSALLYRKIGDSAKTADNATRGLAIARKSGDVERQAELLDLRAWANQRVGQDDAALADWNAARDLLGKLSDDSHIRLRLAAQLASPNVVANVLATISNDVLVHEPGAARLAASRVDGFDQLLRVLEVVGLGDGRRLDLHPLAEALGRVAESQLILHDHGVVKRLRKLQVMDSSELTSSWLSYLRRSTENKNFTAVLASIIARLHSEEAVIAGIRGLFRTRTEQSEGDVGQQLFTLQAVLEEHLTNKEIHRVLRVQFGDDETLLPRTSQGDLNLFRALNGLSRERLIQRSMTALARYAPKCEDALQRIAEDLGLGSIRPLEPFDAAWLSDWPFFDREGLRTACKRLAGRTNDVRVLVVDGPQGSGKSLVADLILHASNVTGTFDCISVDLSGGFPLDELAEKIGLELGSDIESQRSTASSARRSPSFAQYVAKQCAKHVRDVWIVFDNIHHGGGEEEAEFLTELATLATQVEQLRVVLLDSQEFVDIPQSATRRVPLKPITLEHVHDFVASQIEDPKVIEEIVAAATDAFSVQSSQWLGDVQTLIGNLVRVSR